MTDDRFDHAGNIETDMGVAIKVACDSAIHPMTKTSFMHRSDIFLKSLNHQGYEVRKIEDSRDVS